MQLEGKAAIVTGAASGFGEAIARRYAAEGANVVCADIDERGNERTADRIVRQGGAAEAVIEGRLSAQLPIASEKGGEEPQTAASEEPAGEAGDSVDAAPEDTAAEPPPAASEAPARKTVITLKTATNTATEAEQPEAEQPEAEPGTANPSG